MQLFLRWFVGEVLSKYLMTFLSLLRQARADDPAIGAFVLGKVAEAEAKYGGGKGPDKQLYVDVSAKQYALTLGKDIATVGIHALTLVAMEQLGLVAAHMTDAGVPPNSVRTLGSTQGE